MMIYSRLLTLIFLISVACSQKQPARPIYGSQADYLSDGGQLYKLQKPYKIKIQHWKPLKEESYEIR